MNISLVELVLLIIALPSGIILGYGIPYFIDNFIWRKINFDILKRKISRGSSNITIYKLKKGIRETFWMFYFLPAMACLITGLILMVLHIDWYFLIPAVLLAGYSLQNMLFFMKYGKRKKNFHAGSE